MLKAISMQGLFLPFCIAATTSRSPERLLAGGSVFIHELPTFLSCAAARLTPAIKTQQ